MKLIQLVGAASAIGTISLALVGTASADATLSGTTGPNSSQTVTSSTTYSSQTDNANFIGVVSDNIQSANSGGASAKDNTTVGNVSSGAAANSNVSNTSVTIGNIAAGLPGLGAGNGGSVGGSGRSSGSGSNGPSKSEAKPGSGGMVLGASTAAGGSAILPVTGPIVPIDVSALRAAWHRQVLPGPSGLEKTASFFTAGMLIIATLFSLIGAAGSAMYIRSQERRV